MKRIYKGISLILVAAMAFWCCPAYAEEVTVPDALPSVETTGPTPSDIAAAVAPDPLQTAMLYNVPADPAADIVPAPSYPLPIVASAATATDTRIGVDLSAANAASAGWPWYGKAALVAGCVIVVGITTWAIIEASNSGSHDGDSSSHLTVVNNGQDGSVHVTYGNTGGGNSSWRQDH